MGLEHSVCVCVCLSVFVLGNELTQETMAGEWSNNIIVARILGSITQCNTV